MAIAFVYLQRGPLRQVKQLRDPDQPAAQYLLAIAVLAPRHDPAAARAALERAMAANQEPRRFEAWVEPRASYELARLAIEAGDIASARRYLGRALRRSTQPGAVDLALARMRQRAAAGDAEDAVTP